MKHPERKEYRKGGTRQNNVLPVWAAFSYFEMGTMVMIYSYLRGDLRKEVLDYFCQCGRLYHHSQKRRPSGYVGRRGDFKANQILRK